MARPWTPDDIVDQTGRRVLVAAATSGPSRELALALAERGAELVLAGDDLDALADAVRRADAAGSRRPHSLHLDLADLDSARDVAAEVADLVGGRLDLLVLDDAADRAGAPDTAGGVSAALAARVLGPFVMVSRLRAALAAARGRVVTVVPPSYRLARDLSGLTEDPATPDDPDPDPNTDPDPDPGPHEPDTDSRTARLLRRTALGAPAEAALAALLLALELDSRARRHDGGFRSLVAIAGIDVGEAVERTERVRRGRGPSILDAAMGALEKRGDLAHLPVLMAACADLPSSTVVGLSGALGLGREPRIVSPPRPARDTELRARLWQLAREQTGEDLW